MTRSSSLPILLVVALTGSAVVAWRLGWFGGGQEAPPAPAVGPAPAVTAPAPGPAPATVNVDLRTPEQAGIPRDDCMQYPDGTFLPPLNGVKKSPPLVFHRTAPFTKVVGCIKDARGTEWYVHENGIWSTTLPQPNGGAITQVIQAAKPQLTVEDK